MGQPANEKIQKCLNSWREMESKGYKVRLWNDDQIHAFMKRKHPFLVETFVNSRNYAEAADIGRYAIVYSYGGYYADWDVEVLDAERLIRIENENPDGYMLVDPPNGSLASEFFCAAKEDPYLLSLLRDIVEIYETQKRDKLFTPSYSGPFRMRDSLEKHNNTRMNVLPVKNVFAYNYSEIRNPPPGEVTQPLIHYWLHSWIKRYDE
ncbi:hypothetical protein C7T94_03920 [Pedobacter yulinensis]|uniref:Glycosyl transferase n=1 Tax=Pedobacter yulinensis TaxID=2126353 RepID=A0A2T3HND6_9SPHI|nr:hypothetical protein C7T94_03920 [Pedobacter yulinensis]